MDAVELLKHDHRMVEQLFRDYQATGGPPGGPAQRRGVVEVMVRELSKHAALEEVAFYPFARRVLPESQHLVDAQLTGHQTVQELLTELDHLSVGDDRERDLMHDLQAAVARHVATEEDELLPQVADSADPQQLEQLGRALDEAKAVAPTRAHPNAPDTPPMLAIAAPFVAAYDRFRDLIQRRPQT